MPPDVRVNCVGLANNTAETRGFHKRRRSTHSKDDVLSYRSTIMGAEPSMGPVSRVDACATAETTSAQTRTIKTKMAVRRSTNDMAKSRLQ